MERGTLLFFDLDSRTAALGWASGEVDFIVFSLHLLDAELGAMLAAYDKPIPVKYGTSVSVPVPHTVPVHDPATIAAAQIAVTMEDIVLTEYGILTPLGMRRFRAGYGPQSRRWCVRQS